MDEAINLGRKEFPRPNVIPWAISAAALLLLACASLLSLGKIYLIAAGAVISLTAIWFLPFSQAVMAFFLYLLFDGAIKILSNYNPIMHVAQDLIVITLVTRTVAQMGKSGIERLFHTPFMSLILVFLLWIFVQYLNPFNLGALPSIAGTKVYVTGIMLFLVCYQYLQRRDNEAMLRWLALMGLIEGAVATLEYVFFQGYVFRLHPRYAEIAADHFVGALFRPFGTTSAPGAPSMWMFLTLGIATYLLFHAQAKISRLVALGCLAFAVPTLIFCQTRSAMLLSLLSIGVVIFQPNRGYFLRVFGLGALVAVVTSVLFFGNFDRELGLSEAQKKVLTARLFTLTEQKTFLTSRGGAWDGIMSLARFTPFGIGLSRVGAASAVWTDRILRDPYFDKRWSFADNLYRAIFTELGLFGLLSWLIMILFPALYLIRKSMERLPGVRSPLLWLCGTYPLILLIGGFGSEGIMYNPTSSFLWVMMAIGLVELRDAH